MGCGHGTVEEFEYGAHHISLHQLSYPLVLDAEEWDNGTVVASGGTMVLETDGMRDNNLMNLL